MNTGIEWEHWMRMQVLCKPVDVALWPCSQRTWAQKRSQKEKTWGHWLCRTGLAAFPLCELKLLVPTLWSLPRVAGCSLCVYWIDFVACTQRCWGCWCTFPVLQKAWAAWTKIMAVPTSAEKRPKEELPVNADQDLSCPRTRGAAFVGDILHMVMVSQSEQIVFCLQWNGIWCVLANIGWHTWTVCIWTKPELMYFLDTVTQVN